MSFGTQAAEAAGALLHEQLGDLVGMASGLDRGGREDVLEVVIGSQNEIRTTLPLSPAEAFLATDRQRSRIGKIVLQNILDELPTSQRGSFSELRDELIRRTGLNDAAASLVLYAMRGRLRDWRGAF